jgi:hypothetical protein
VEENQRKHYPSSPSMLAGCLALLHTLPTELLVREELVGVLVIGVHIIFRERHEQKDMRLTSCELSIGCPFGSDRGS